MKHSGMLPSHCRCHLCFEQPEKRKTPCASPVRYAGGVFIPLPFPLFHRSSTETGFSNMQKNPDHKNTRMKHSGMLPSHCRCRPCFEQPEKRKTPCASPVRYTGRVFTPLPFPLFYRSSAETGFSNMQKSPDHKALYQDKTRTEMEL